MVSYKQVRPAQVSLDPNNPRLEDVTASDSEAINRLLDEGFDALLRLSRDIASQGIANPAELPILIKNGSRYIALEGNRRFAALRLLADPNLAENSEQRRAFKRIAENGNIPRSVMCLVVETREQADHWIDLRHTGYNDGVGVKNWSAQQSARRRQRSNKSVDSGTQRSIALADSFEEAFSADTELTNLIKQVRRSKLTNIGRFFSSDVLTRLHLTMREEVAGGRSVWSRYPASSLHKFVQWAMAYINDNGVDSYKNADVRSALLTKNVSMMPLAGDLLDHPARLVDAPLLGSAHDSPDSNSEDSAESPSDGTPSSPGGQQGREANGSGGQTNDSGLSPRSTRPAGEDRFIFQRTRLIHSSERIRSLLRDTRKLPIADYSQVLSVICRVVVELVVSQSKLLAWAGVSEKDYLYVKIQACIRGLDPKVESSRGYDPELRQAWLESQTLGVMYLNQFVHSPAVRVDPQLVLRFSSAFTPMLQRLDDVLGGLP